jgi:cysteine synthase
MSRVSNLESYSFTAVEETVGKTPIIRLRLRHCGIERQIFAKAEMSNYSGSIKDRMALSILRDARASGALQLGQAIAEATSGNAGIAIAALGSALGHPVTIFMPDWMSAERRALIASYGAELCLVSKREGGFLAAIAAAERIGTERGHFLPRQFSNAANCRAHYHGTAQEIWQQMAQLDAVPAAFVAGVGTGGTVMGVGRFLKEQDESIHVHPVEPAESPTMSTGYKVGQHRIQGVSDEFIPDLVKLDQLDEIIAVHDGDAILMAQYLCHKFGLGVGISSGANLVAALKAAQIMDRAGKPPGAIATIFCDSQMKYLSTDLMKAEPLRAGYLTPETELLSMDIFRYSNNTVMRRAKAA